MKLLASLSLTLLAILPALCWPANHDYGPSYEDMKAYFSEMQEQDGGHGETLFIQLMCL